MSNVSKLVIKACSDNKFSSFTGEFTTSINPEHLVIKSAVSYHVPQGMPSSGLLKYCGSPPKLLSFSVLFDNTGIMPGSNTVAVMAQVKQLQDVAYSIHKKNNAPNYIRIIWGQIDFKGRLVDLDIVYSMFQVDGTLVRAEAHISVLEELVPLGKGESAAGVDSNYAKASGVDATSYQSVDPGQGPPSQEVFAPTPNGMHGAYSGAPSGAYDGGPDDIYHGSNGSGRGYGSSVGRADSGRSVSGSAIPDVDHSGSRFKGGVAGNGPGGSGGGIGGGGDGPVRGTAPSGGAPSPPGTASPASGSGTSGSSRGAGSGPAGSVKSNLAAESDSGKSKGKGSRFKAGSIVAAGLAGSAAAAGGVNSLRKISDLKANINLMKGKVDFLRRFKNFSKKVAPKAYNAGKKLLQ